MSFVDKVEVHIKAGRGGDGHRSFRTERYVAKGGPDGGDGGDGGSIIFEASNNQNTLATYRYNREITAEDGQDGGKSRKHGKRGIDLVAKVPVGTIVTDLEGNMIADLTFNSQREVIAKGGKGGFGNAHFVSSVRQAPNFAEKGEGGQEFGATLELKLIADVGLVGLPNAGKSTLLSVLSNARPEIADYPFTTLIPNLGVVDITKHTSLLLADIPGLIEGASSGKGLGHQFLKHVERTKLILHLIDIYSEDIAKDYYVIRNELEAYSKKLAKLNEIIVLNKIEGLDEKVIAEKVALLKSQLPKNAKILVISAKAKTNLNELKYYLKEMMDKYKQKRPKVQKDSVPVVTLKDTTSAFKISKLKKGFMVRGDKIERFASRTDFENQEAARRLLVIMKKMGVLHELRRQGYSGVEPIYFGVDKKHILEKKDE